MNIREEVETDIKQIHDLTIAAFETAPFSSGTEAKIIETLRNDGDLQISLVAELEGKLISHIAFSPVKIENASGNWFGLGPVSVHPNHQKRGIGKMLIEQGLAHLKNLNADGCVLVGDPDYYSRFGFVSDGHITYPGIPTEYVQWLSFGGYTPEGAVTYSPAFTIEGTSQ